MEIETVYYYHPNEYFLIDIRILDMPEVQTSYTIRGEDVEKFMDALKKEYQGTLEQMCEQAFGYKINSHLFDAFCKQHAVQYKFDCDIVV